MAKTWSIVKFKAEEAVEAVPTSWIVGSSCYWPPLISSDKVIAAIRKNEEPNSCWPLHEIVVFRNSTYDDYLLARKKAKKAESTSDLNSDNENLPRKRIARRFSSSDSDEFVEELDLPSPPHLSETTMKEPETFRTDEEIEVPIQKTNGDLGCSCSIHYKEYGEALKSLEKYMVRQHHFIRAALTDILEEVRLVKLDSKPADQEVRISIFEKYNFPIRSDEALLELEKHLADEEARKLVVTDLAKVGGKTTYEFVKRTLGTLVDDAILKKYSWLGAKKKLIFKDLKLADAILRAAVKNGSASNKATEEEIKKYLRRAKERDLNRREKEKDKTE